MHCIHASNLSQRKKHLPIYVIEHETTHNRLMLRYWIFTGYPILYLLYDFCTTPIEVNIIAQNLEDMIGAISMTTSKWEESHPQFDA